SAAPVAITAQEVAKGLSMFEIDESLEALVEAAEQEAEANDGEISESIKTALATYAEAFGHKVDRIADYLKAQKAEAELARREAERFQARHNAAENREKRLKQMLVWFMVSRDTTKLRGILNTISLQANSIPSLVIQETTHIPDSFYRAKVELTWPEWREIVELLPSCPLRNRLENADGRAVQKELQRGILSDALTRGDTIEGVSLIKGKHVRLR
ncbi:MAG: siphovirus Gp157 family protein, partial [Bryobacteraceae bacterium]|nr:siphovirus Gp157 family protein [Bryobacteraceae bacterium]